jgi:ATP-dependent Clp protease ATP-binding subunit ClpC
VAETTTSELDACRRLLPGLSDLFEIVRITEFAAAQARELLSRLFVEAGRNDNLEIEVGLADLIFRLFKRFQPYSAFPGRTVAFVRHLLDDLTRQESRCLTQADVLNRFQRETGLPQRLLRDDLLLPYDDVLREFRGSVLGQDAPCETAAGVVMALKTGLNDPHRPLGVLLFCGPTGVGKTEMAKTLAKQLFGAGAVQDRLVRLDMSEYAGLGAVHRLMMSADGEVSPFIKRVRRQPFVLVLLDEIEKAAPEVHDVLLGMLDEGRLTDRFGRTTAFQSAVIVMTSNLGAERLSAVGFDNAAQPPFERIAMQTFRPEFFNRIDAVVTFQPLPHDVISALARRELTAVGRRDGLVKRSLRISWTDAVVERLVTIGYDVRFGARPLLRALERFVVAPIARWLLANPGVKNRTLTLDVGSDGQITMQDAPLS